MSNLDSNKYWEHGSEAPVKYATSGFTYESDIQLLYFFLFCVLLAFFHFSILSIYITVKKMLNSALGQLNNCIS